MVTMALVALAAATVAGAGAPRIPIIATGWDSPSPRQFREGMAAFEAWGVFDGTTLRATRTGPKGEEPAINAFGRDRWAWPEFAGALADLQAARPTACRQNYLMLYSNPGDVDWFDDAGWREVVEHWRLLSRLARQGGLRGILFDAEPYTPPHSQFLYAAQPGRDRHSFEEYRAMARKRGREVMRAVRSEYPEIGLFAYRLFSDMLGLLESGDMARALAADTYGLLPSFVDGWLDVMPTSVRVIEGTEDIGYRANSPAEYNGAYTRLRLRLPDFTAPEHREKVNRQFGIGQSMYLDAYVNPPGNPWHIPREGTTAAARLAANLSSALAATDGLVWLYGERARWWPSADAKIPAWPAYLPGVLGAIRRARDPQAFAIAALTRTPALANLLPNPGLAPAAGTDAPPDGWFVWQEEGSHGTQRTENGAVELSGMRGGVVGCSVKVAPGRCFAARASVRSEGHGQGTLLIAWKTPAGVWTDGPANRRLVATGKPDAAGWLEISGLVQAPPTAGQLILMAAAAGQVGPTDRCWFRRPVLVDAGD